MQTEELLTIHELAAYLKVHRVTIFRWNRQGVPRVRIGHRTTRYKLSEVLAWLEQRGGVRK